MFEKNGGVSWKDRKTNEEVLRQLKTERKLLKTVKQRKLRYFGHVKRQNGFLKMTMEGKLEGRRSRGKRRTSWADNVEEWTGRRK